METLFPEYPAPDTRPEFGPPAPPNSLTLPYIPVDAFTGIRLPDDELSDLRWFYLARLGVERRDDVAPLVAWRDHVADVNHLPRAALDPAQGGSLDLLFAPAAVRDWVFFLA